MANQDSITVLIGVFPNDSEAQHFVDELRRAGFRQEQIGVLSRQLGEPVEETQAEEGATVGALAGGIWGVLFGAAVATGLIPGVGPIIAGGLLAGLATGAAFGAVAGGVLGALVGLGIPEEEARRYESEFLQGRTLVVVKGEGRLAEAAAILNRMRESEAKTPARGAPAAEGEGLEQLDELL